MLSPDEFTAKLEALHDKQRVIGIEISFLISDYFKKSVVEFKREAESTHEEIVGAIEYDNSTLLDVMRDIYNANDGPIR